MNNVTRSSRSARPARRLDQLPLLHRLRGRRPRQPAGVPSGAPNNNCGRRHPRSRSTGGTSTVVGARDNTRRLHRDPVRLLRRAQRQGALQRHAAILGRARATFKQGYETVGPQLRRIIAADSIANCVRPGNCDARPSAPARWPSGRAKLDLVDSSAGFANDPGCFYTGDTRIRFKSDGTMDVWNTTSVGTTLTGPGTPAGTNCGVAANFKPARFRDEPKAPAAPQNVPVPDDMVIYVKNSARPPAPAPPARSSTAPPPVARPATSSRRGRDLRRGGHRHLLQRPRRRDHDDEQDVHPGDQHDDDRGSTRQRPSRSPRPATATRRPSTAVRATSTSRARCTGRGDHRRAEQRHRDQRPDARRNDAADGRLRQRQGRDRLGHRRAGGRQLGGRVPPRVAAEHHGRSDGDLRQQLLDDCRQRADLDGQHHGHERHLCLERDPDLHEHHGQLRRHRLPGADQLDDSACDLRLASQTLQHSFWVAYYKYGNSLGHAQRPRLHRPEVAWHRRYRHEATSTATGFKKDYSYDTRLKFLSPPYFPQWTNAAQWSARRRVS